MVLIYGAPDDAVAARQSLAIGKSGMVRTTTLKAFPEEDYRKIVSAVS